MSTVMDLDQARRRRAVRRDAASIGKVGATTPIRPVRRARQANQPAVATPGLLWGEYPERRPPPRSWLRQSVRWLQQWVDAADDALAAVSPRWQQTRHARGLARLATARDALAAFSPHDARARVREALLRYGLDEPALSLALALAADEAERQLGVRPYDTQLIAARVVLGNGLAEMATGEGKTLTVALAAAVAAMAGIPVHVVTANDYLVARDADKSRPLFQALDLSVGHVLPADGPEARALAYASSITYVTAKELVFDYLRDAVTAPAGPGRPQRPRREGLPTPLARLAGRSSTPPLLRGLCMAIVDEADAVLLDEARVPLILSQPLGDTQAMQHARQTLSFARNLKVGLHVQLDAENQRATLTGQGRAKLEAATDQLVQASHSPAWRHRLHREHAVSSALAALHLYHRDRHYIVRDDRVQLIDETTGRVADGRQWSDGLQQLIELKEGCTVSPPSTTLAQLTYQRFFPRYLRLGGLSGTLREARAELMSSYGLSVHTVPLRLPSQRSTAPTRLYADHRVLWPVVAQRIADLHRRGQPVLVATDSVADAQALALALTELQLPHAVLHARNDQHEAEVVADAGQRSAITVTTNLSGRGTDIAVEPSVQRLGGLHVICCQLNGARRIDRQLAGRAARQGEPGSVQTLLSLDNPLLAEAWPAWVKHRLRARAPHLPMWLVRTLVRWPQWTEERRQREQRRRLMAHDERAERELGPSERAA